jgi:hypothetical protein
MEVKAMAPLTYDARAVSSEIASAIENLFDPDTVVELRALKVPKRGTVSG